MKNCAFCAEEIQDAAIKCRHCQSAVASPQDTSAPSRWSVRRVLSGAFVGLYLIGYSGNGLLMIIHWLLRILSNPINLINPLVYIQVFFAVISSPLCWVFLAFTLLGLAGGYFLSRIPEGSPSGDGVGILVLLTFFGLLWFGRSHFQNADIEPRVLVCGKEKRESAVVAIEYRANLERQEVYLRVSAYGLGPERETEISTLTDCVVWSRTHWECNDKNQRVRRNEGKILIQSNDKWVSIVESIQSSDNEARLLGLWEFGQIKFLDKSPQSLCFKK